MIYFILFPSFKTPFHIFLHNFFNYIDGSFSSFVASKQIRQFVCAFLTNNNQALFGNDFIFIIVNKLLFYYDSEIY